MHRNINQPDLPASPPRPPRVLLIDFRADLRTAEQDYSALKEMRTVLWRDRKRADVITQKMDTLAREMTQLRVDIRALEYARNN